MRDEDEDEVPQYLLAIDGGPPSKPKPLYNDGLVLSIASLLDAGARLLAVDQHTDAAQRRALWDLFASGKRLTDREIKRREEKNKAAGG